MLAISNTFDTAHPSLDELACLMSWLSRRLKDVVLQTFMIVMIRYIENINISFLIAYRYIVSYHIIKK